MTRRNEENSPVLIGNAGNKSVTNTQPLMVHRLPRVEERVGLRRSRIYELMSEDKFPRPVEVGRVRGWISSEIDEWIVERIRERDAKQ
jgi:prophage regulatory protein